MAKEECSVSSLSGLQRCKEAVESFFLTFRDTLEEEIKEIQIKRSRKIFTKFSPQLLWISLFISSSYHANAAHFSTGKTCLPKK